MSAESEAPAPAPAAAAAPKLKTWEDCTPTGHPLRTLDPSNVPPYVKGRYEEQTDNQDFIIKIEETHPSKLNANERSYGRGVVRFYEEISTMLIPSFKTGNLNTANLPFLDPHHYYLPHPSRSTRETDPRIGTVLHAVDLVWLKHEDAKVPYDKIVPEMLRHPAAVIGSLVPGMWVSRSAGPSEDDAKNNKRYAILFPFRQFQGETREPQLLCVELSKKKNNEHFLDSQSVLYRHIEASEIRAFGNNSNRSRSVRAVLCISARYNADFSSRKRNGHSPKHFSANVIETWIARNSLRRRGVVHSPTDNRMDLRSYLMCSVNNSVNELLEEALKNEFHYFSDYPLPEGGGFSEVVEAQNKITGKDEKRDAIQTAFREFSAQTVLKSKGENNNFGIRHEGSKFYYKVPVFENGKPVDRPPEELERICNKTHEIYDKMIIRTLLRLSHAAHLCYEYDFRAKQSPEEMFKERMRKFEEELLVLEEFLIEDLQKVEWNQESIQHTYEFVDVVPIPDFEVGLGYASVRFGPYLKPYPRT